MILILVLLGQRVSDRMKFRPFQRIRPLDYKIQIKVMVTTPTNRLTILAKVDNLAIHFNP